MRIYHLGFGFIFVILMYFLLFINGYSSLEGAYGMNCVYKSYPYVFGGGNTAG